MSSWKTLSRKVILDHSLYLKVEDHVVVAPNGKKIDNWPWVISRDFVNIVPLLPDGKVLLFRQSKYGYAGLSLAPIGGYMEPGETPDQTAHRELLEETGYQAGEMTLLHSLVADPNRGYATGHGFLASGLTYLGPQESDDLEEQEQVFLSEDELEEVLLSGEVKVAAWYATLAHALLYLKREK